MRTKPFWTTFLVLILIGIMPVLVLSATITEKDSTQPRGTPLKQDFNDQKQLLDPIIHGFRAPAYRGTEKHRNYDYSQIFFDWSGMLMANAMRDPAFFATLSVANRDVIRLFNKLAQDESYIKKLFVEPAKDMSFKELVKFLKLDKDVSHDERKLQPEGILPITADLCLRCHTPVGWMEAHSEPPTYYSPFLKGQFWGANILEGPPDDKRDMYTKSQLKNWESCTSKG